MYNMMYLIGGVPRAGKSTLAQKLVERRSISFVSTDVILHMVSDTLPDLSLTKPYDDIPAKFFPYIRNLLKHLESSVRAYTVEGDIITPSQVKLLQNEYEVKACFLGFSFITLRQLQEYVGDNNWIGELSEEERTNLPPWIMKKSAQIRQECDKYGLMYIDMSSDVYEACLERAYRYLTE